MKCNERRAWLEVSAESGRVGTALCARAYSPKCLEEKFSEVAPLRIAQHTWPHRTPWRGFP